LHEGFQYPYFYIVYNIRCFNLFTIASETIFICQGILKMGETKCPHCDLPIPAGKFICPNCGIDIRDWNPDKLRCPLCRTLYPPGTKFCLKDGSPLEPAVVDFDTEATIFLSGGLTPSSGKKDDLIPKLKFFKDDDRKIPRLNRDTSGKIAPPPPLKPIQDSPPPLPNSPPPKKKESGITHPKPPPLSLDISTPDSGEQKQTTTEPPPKPTQVPEELPPKFIDMTRSVGTARKGAYKIKPLEEYEKLLREEKKSRVKSKKIRKKPRKTPRPGFFKRVVTALKILIGKG